MRHYILPIFFLFLFSPALWAQSYKTKDDVDKKTLKLYEKGEAYNKKLDTHKAIECYDQALQREPRFIDAMVNRAAVLYERAKDSAAEAALEEIVALDPYYNTKILYILGGLKKHLGKCDEAIPYYQQYADAPEPNARLAEKALELVKDCEFILEQSRTAKNLAEYQAQSLSPLINTRDREYLPSLSADGMQFFFTRVVRGQEDIYYSLKTPDGWGHPVALNSLNTPDNEGNQSISADGRMMVFTACNRKDTGYGGCDLYLSEFKDGAWTPVRNMGRAINTHDWESQPSLSADGNTLYFAARRKGKSDIYYSRRNEEGAWSVAKPVPGKVNTKDEEETPFIHPDGQTLYFKSKGHRGFGGYDIFLSRLQGDGTWGEPQNLGSFINTPGNEGSFIVALNGQTAYFDSDQDWETGKGISPNLHDIFQIKLPPEARPQPTTYVKAQVVDADTRRPLLARVDFLDLSTQRPHAYKQTDAGGTFLICLPLGKDYSLNVSSDGYLFHSENFALSADMVDGEQPYILEIALQAIPPSVAEKPGPSPQPNSSPKPESAKPTILRNIFFATGSAELQPQSHHELMHLHQLLTENPRMNIQINGHTDDVGHDADNQILSEQRAKAVVDFLREQGIAAQRLRHRGFGESQPMDTNDTPQGRQNNRRTEFVILE